MASGKYRRTDVVLYASQVGDNTNLGDLGTDLLATDWVLELACGGRYIMSDIEFLGCEGRYVKVDDGTASVGTYWQ